MALILIVEDEKLLRWSLQKRLEKVGHDVHPAENLAAALLHLKQHQPDLMLLDLSLPDGHGLDFFQQQKERLEGTVVLIMTATGEVDDAVRAMKLGALDFLSKPIEHEALVELVDRSLKYRADQLEAEGSRRARQKQLSKSVVSGSSAFERTLEMAQGVAASEIDSILLQGESGTGKNVVARHIHASSSRSEKPLIEVSCAAIPDNLMESELFGHEKGAFTDAKATKKGSFELAEGGTVMLDEIGELKLELQSKLLHFLEERHFRRVGGVREIKVDVRIIALTNRNLRQMVVDKEFRDDLYYRLSVFPIQVPPLRERRDDILPLANHFVKTLKAKFGRKIDGFDREAENVLLGYSWPGNVRELRNVVERAMILEKSQLITIRSLILDTIQAASPDAVGSVGGMPEGIVPLEELEREMVRRAMEASSDNQTRAAELLAITRDQLRYRLKKFSE